MYQDGNSGTLENAVGTAPGQWMPRETGQQEWKQLLPVVHKQHLQARGQKVVEFGRYKHSTYDVAYQGDNYRRWVIANIDEASVSGMKALKQYFLERMKFNHNNRRSVFMALRRHPGSWAANTRLRFWMLDVTCRAMEVDGWKGTPRSRTSRYHLFDRTQRAGQVSACARAKERSQQLQCFRSRSFCLGAVPKTWTLFREVNVGKSCSSTCGISEFQPALPKFR